MAFELSGTTHNGPLTSNSRLFGVLTGDGDSAPEMFSPSIVSDYVESQLAAVAASGSASDLSTGTLPLGRLHGRIADFANIDDYVQGDIFYFNGFNIVNLAPGVDGQFLRTRASGANPMWDTVTSASGGDVLGPASSTDNALARFDGPSGGAIQNSGIIVDDSNNISGIGTLASGAITSTGLLTASLAGNAGRFVNTTDNASVQVIRLEGDRATMADGDEAYASMLLSNDGGTQTEFARLTWVAVDVNAGTSVDGRLDLGVVTAGTLADELSLDGAALYPSTNGGLNLGIASTNEFGGLRLGSGASIGWNNGNVLLTQSSGTLTLAGALTFDAYTRAISWTNTPNGTPVCAFGGPSDGVDVFLGIAGGSRITTTGGENVGIGFTTLGSLTAGAVANVAIGGGALLAATSGSRNIAIGRHAMRNSTTGSDNVCIGEFAMDGVVATSAGDRNVAIGPNAYTVAGGTDNVAVGSKAMWTATGINCVAIGALAISSPGGPSGNSNTAIGYSTQASLSSGAQNSSVGQNSLNSCTTGGNNAALGWRAGYDITTGSGNIYLGSFDSVAAYITTGSNNIFIGNDVRTGISQTGSAQLNIGNLIFGQSVGTGSTLSTGTIGIGIAASAAAVLGLAAGTTAKAPMVLASGTNLTTAAAGAVEHDGKVFYATSVASSRQAVVGQQLAVLAANYVLTDSGSAQKIFDASSNGTITLAASTSYFFEALYLLTNTGTTSHTWATLFGGTATLTSIAYLAQAHTNTGNVLTAVSQIYATAATATVVTGASTSATENVVVKLSGVIRVNGAGTLIPQIQASAQPNGTETILANSWFRCWPIGTNTVAAVGNWS